MVAMAVHVITKAIYPPIRTAAMVVHLVGQKPAAEEYSAGTKGPGSCSQAHEGLRRERRIFSRSACGRGREPVV